MYEQAISVASRRYCLYNLTVGTGLTNTTKRKAFMIKKLILLPILMLMLAPLSVVSADQYVSDNPIKERKAGFKASKKSLKTIHRAIKRDDSQTISERAEQLVSFSKIIPDLFPNDARGSFLSRAKGGIWVNFEDFTEKAAAFQQSAEAFQAELVKDESDKQSLERKLREIANSCDSCHDSYRRF